MSTDHPISTNPTPDASDDEPALASTDNIDPTNATLLPRDEAALEDHGWYAEVGARRRVRSRYPEAARLDMIYPAKPDPMRSRYFEPDGRHSDYALNDELKAIRGVEVTDSYIRIPHRTVEALEVDPNARDELDQLVSRILSKMRVDEIERDGDIRYRIPDDPNTVTDDERRTDPRPVFVDAVPGSHWCALQELKEKRNVESRDIKGLITARDSETGTGKTTLGEVLCLDWDRADGGWDAEDQATLDGDAYTEAYLELPKGAMLLGDEMEQMADNRRSTSTNNVTITQFWSVMRAWEVSTIATLPSTSMLDKRMKELADFRINVIERGIATVYLSKVDDMDGQVFEKRLHRVRWKALDGHPGHKRLAEKKKEHMDNYAENFYFVNDEDDDLAVDDLPLSLRNRIWMMLDENGVRHEDMADAWGMSRPTVSKGIKKVREAAKEETS